MTKRVHSGDPDNVEAQAARVYWPLLFGDPKFRRGREGPDQNQSLNYGYTVLRAACARAVCAAGLHPSFGLQHHNRYDAFSLAADLMEPFRPLVDRAVVWWGRDHDATVFDRAAKTFLLRHLMARYIVEGEARTLFDILARTTSNLARVIIGECGTFEIPDIHHSSKTLSLWPVGD